MSDAAARRSDPVQGWRLWALGRSPDGWRLTSPFSPSEWRPRVPMRASCHLTERLPGVPEEVLRELRHDSDAPDLRCGCGVYAYSAGPFFEDFLVDGQPPHKLGFLVAAPENASVVGQVAGWGRIIEHTKGWRAAFAYPSSLALVCGECLRLRAALTPATRVVATRVSRDPRPMGACDAHSHRWAVTMAAAPEVEAELLALYGVVRANAPVITGGRTSVVAESGADATTVAASGTDRADRERDERTARPLDPAVVAAGIAGIVGLFALIPALGLLLSLMNLAE